MSLLLYESTPLSSGSQVDPLDIFIANGSSATFTLVNKTVSRLGTTIQAGNTQYYFFNGGFTKNAGANSFTLSTIPAAGSVVIAPGLNSINPSAFDQTSVPGQATPNVTSIPFWLADISTIYLYNYIALPGSSGINVSIVNESTAFGGVQPSWVQMCVADASGNPTTYGATGVGVTFPPLTTVQTVTATSFVGATSMLVDVASTFYPGCYVNVNIGALTQELLHLTAINGNTISFDSPTGFNHYPGEPVYQFGYKGYMQVTVPQNAANNTAVNLYNCGVFVNCGQTTKV